MLKCGQDSSMALKVHEAFAFAPIRRGICSNLLATPTPLSTMCTQCSCLNASRVPNLQMQAAAQSTTFVDWAKPSRATSKAWKRIRLPRNSREAPRRWEITEKDNQNNNQSGASGKPTERTVVTLASWGWSSEALLGLPTAPRRGPDLLSQLQATSDAS